MITFKRLRDVFRSTQGGTIMKLMLHYIKNHIGMFFVAVLFLSIETFADLLQPAFMSCIVDRGIKGQELRLVLGYGLIMLGITAMGAVGAVVRNIYASRTSQLIGKEIRLAIYEKVHTLSYENIDRLQPASIITRITNDVTQMQNFINGMMRIMLKAPVTCIGAVALIILQMPGLLPLMLAILVCAGLLIYGVTATASPYAVRTTSAALSTATPCARRRVRTFTSG